MLVSLALPIALTAVALFFASFLSWMVLQLHKNDWRKLKMEDEIMAAVASANVPEGGYMFPGTEGCDMRSPEFQKKYETGPRGLLTILPVANMGQLLGLTIVYFLVVSFLLAYLGTMGLKPGTDFLTVFRFFFVAGLLAFLAAMVQHAIWFRPRIVGHVIESIAYATITGLIFASLWPAA